MLTSPTPKRFKIPIIRFVKFLGDPPQYRVETALGDVQLGTLDALISQGKLRLRLAAATNLLFPAFKPKDWSKLEQKLLDACEIVDRGDDATLRGGIERYLCRYLSDNPPSSNQNPVGREPFFRNGRIYIFVDSVIEFVHLN